VEEEVDKVVAGLYGITGEELEDVKNTLGFERMISDSFIYIYSHN